MTPERRKTLPIGLIAGWNREEIAAYLAWRTKESLAGAGGTNCPSTSTSANAAQCSRAPRSLTRGGSPGIEAVRIVDPVSERAPRTGVWVAVLGVVAACAAVRRGAKLATNRTRRRDPRGSPVMRMLTRNTSQGPLTSTARRSGKCGRQRAILRSGGGC